MKTITYNNVPQQSVLKESLRSENKDVIFIVKHKDQYKCTIQNGVFITGNNNG